MQDIEQQLLQASAKVFQLLGSVPNGELRLQYLDLLDQALNLRGDILTEFNQQGVQLNKENSTHKILLELDAGIQERLKSVMSTIKQDMKNIQSAKKNEGQYINPYASVRVLDGKYYDQKK